MAEITVVEIRTMGDSSTKIIDAMVTSTWLKSRAASGEHARPNFVVTVSRQCGSFGEEISELLAQRLNLPHFNKNLVEKVAEEAGIQPDVFKRLEDKIVRLKPTWFESVFSSRPWLQAKYTRHLMSVLLGISRIGGVILGRGAHLLLGQKTCLRVRIVAPLDVRVDRYAERTGLDWKTAKKAVKETDEERKNFIKMLFHKNLQRPDDFDLTINTERISVEAAVDSILDVLESSAPESCACSKKISQ